MIIISTVSTIYRLLLRFVMGVETSRYLSLYLQLKNHFCNVNDETVFGSQAPSFVYDHDNQIFLQNRKLLKKGTELTLISQ